MKSKTLTVRPATRDDIKSYLGETYEKTFRGIVAVDNDVIKGVAGVMHTMPLQAFSTIDDELSDNPRFIVKVISEFKHVLREYKEDIFAVPNPNKKTAEGFLTHVGFEPYEEGIYKWVIQ